jgi:hypothetical protein
VIAEIAMNDPVLNQAAENEVEAARRESELSADHKIRRQRQQHAAAECKRRQANVRLRLRERPGKGAQNEKKSDDAKRQRQNGHMACDRGRVHTDEKYDLPVPQAIRMAGEQRRAEHEHRHQDVGHELCGVPGQRREGAKSGHDRGGEPRPVAQSVHAQRQHHEPGHQRRLQDDVRPELMVDADRQEGAIECRAAHPERFFERPLEIASGIVEHDRKPVPQGRPDQRKQHQGDRK